MSLSLRKPTLLTKTHILCDDHHKPDFFMRGLYDWAIFIEHQVTRPRISGIYQAQMAKPASICIICAPRGSLLLKKYAVQSLTSRISKRQTAKIVTQNVSFFFVCNFFVCVSHTKYDTDILKNDFLIENHETVSVPVR